MCGGCGAPSWPVHRECLQSRPDHRPNRRPGDTGRRARQCVEVDFKEYIFTMYLLDPQAIDATSVELHTADVFCTWIGLPPIQTDRFPQIYVWPRLQELLNGSGIQFKEQYPNLVSFIGESGSGKSTLIRALMHMIRPYEIGGHTVPVPGTANDRWKSTSSGVHLYGDPETLSSKCPTLYAGKLHRLQIRE